jgi:large repetitive protein
MLVKALDRPEALANNPMQALFEFRQQVPPSRGALWLAAGLRGTAFQIVNITAVL